MALPTHWITASTANNMDRRNLLNYYANQDGAVDGSIDGTMDGVFDPQAAAEVTLPQVIEDFSGGLGDYSGDLVGASVVSTPTPPVADQWLEYDNGGNGGVLAMFYGGSGPDVRQGRTYNIIARPDSTAAFYPGFLIFCDPNSVDGSDFDGLKFNFDTGASDDFQLRYYVGGSGTTISSDGVSYSKGTDYQILFTVNNDDTIDYELRNYDTDTNMVTRNGVDMTDGGSFSPFYEGVRGYTIDTSFNTNRAAYFGQLTRTA